MIIVKYHGPTDTRGARFVCSSPDYRSRTFSFDYSAPDAYHAALRSYADYLRIMPREYVYRSKDDATRVYISTGALRVTA